MELKERKQEVIITLDAETDGLHGRAFAIGAIVYDVKPDKELHRFEFLEDCKIENEWVKVNVLPHLSDMPRCGRAELLPMFSKFYKEMNEKYDTTVLWHMGHVVEASLFRDMYEEKLIGEFESPYTPIEVSEYLRILGYRPDSVDSYLKEKGIDVAFTGSTHNPTYDARVAYVAYMQLLEEFKQKLKTV